MTFDTIQQSDDDTACTEQAATASPCSADDSPDADEARPNRGQDRLWTPLFVCIVAATLCCYLTSQGVNTGTSVYLAYTGNGAAFSGVLAAVFSAAAAGTRIVCGPIVDRTGRYRVLLAGAALLAVGTALPAFVSNDVVFVLCRIMQGVGFSAATTASATAAADVLPRSRMGEGIGYYGLGQAIAMSVGPAFALALVATDPHENLYLGLAAVAIVGLFVAALCRYERHPEKLPPTSAYRRQAERPRKPAGKFRLSDALERRALPGALPMLMLCPVFGFGIFFVGLYGTSVGVGNPGLFYTLSALSMIAVRLRSQSFMDRVAPLKVFSIAIACGLAAFLLLQAAPLNTLAYYAAGLLYGVCLGISMPLNQTVAVKNTPLERWGAGNALYLLACDVGVGIGAAAWGFINEAAGFTTSLWCAMACMVAALLIAKLVYPQESRAL
ncbi:MAG: MFS transporter [Gordonibacter sp.]|uniref:MFS transporter n=1 Tax=Gordonibacter sp. TaxID=1968902 RepID=UPI002FCC03E5